MNEEVDVHVNFLLIPLRNVLLFLFHVLKEILFPRRWQWKACTRGTSWSLYSRNLLMSYAYKHRSLATNLNEKNDLKNRISKGCETWDPMKRENEKNCWRSKYLYSPLSLSPFHIADNCVDVPRRSRSLAGVDLADPKGTGRPRERPSNRGSWSRKIRQTSDAFSEDRSATAGIICITNFKAMCALVKY